ncbi:hypothetical protein D3C80_1315250 [compost metagenome]
MPYTATENRAETHTSLFGRTRRTLPADADELNPQVAAAEVRVPQKFWPVNRGSRCESSLPTEKSRPTLDRAYPELSYETKVQNL